MRFPFARSSSVAVLALVLGCAPAARPPETGTAIPVTFAGNRSILDIDLRVAVETTPGSNDDAELARRYEQAVESMYFDRGWLDAKAKSTYARNDRGELAISVKVTEGLRFRVSTVVIDDTTHAVATPPFTTPALRELVPLSDGDFLSRDAGATGTRQLAEYFHSRGVPDAIVAPESRIDREHASVVLAFHVEHGGTADAGAVR